MTKHFFLFPQNQVRCVFNEILALQTRNQIHDYYINTYYIGALLPQDRLFCMVAYQVNLLR